MCNFTFRELSSSHLSTGLVLTDFESGAWGKSSEHGVPIYHVKRGSQLVTFPLCMGTEGLVTVQIPQPSHSVGGDALSTLGGVECMDFSH